jgi:antitoxin (DNA-binding transcriptional repressor) of toxin-antitoxin stability system
MYILCYDPGMQASTTVSATQGRLHFFDLIEAAFAKGQTTQITRSGKVVATIAPPTVAPAFSMSEYRASIHRLRKILTPADYKQMEQARATSKKKRFPDW